MKSSTLSKKYVDCLNDVMQSYDDFYDECIIHKLANDYKEEIDFIFWSGYFLLPMIAKARDADKFSECPVLGQLAFVDLGETEVKSIAEALIEISI